MPALFHPRRELGRTGFQATVLGIGDLADRNVPLADCVATIHRALDAGLNVIDTAPGYEDGYSEQIVGTALKGRRAGVFVIDKIDDLDAPVAPQIEANLKRLGTQPDLFVFHAVSTLDQWRKLRWDELAGKSRWHGISCHNPDVLRVAIPSGLCDVVMFPVGPFVDIRYITECLPLARQHRVGTVCFKTFGAGKLLGDTEGYNRALAPLRAGLTTRPRGKISSGGGTAQPVLPTLTVEQCIRYTLTCDPDVALFGLSFPNEQDAAFAAAANFTPFTPTEMESTRRAAATAITGKGHCWWNP
jgi:aryl-alcohol dehydrogenase-like predicted oxidoreductase